MSWDRSAVHQDFGATGSYNANSAIAKQYAGLEEDTGSRVDDGEGWRQINRDDPPKTAAEYEKLVKKYSAAGFDVKAIDMDGDDFTHSNIAIKPKEGGGEKPSGPVAMSPRLAHAQARVKQHEEDIFSGKYQLTCMTRTGPDGAHLSSNVTKKSWANSWTTVTTRSDYPANAKRSINH